jgi:hypothetical protein
MEYPIYIISNYKTIMGPSNTHAVIAASDEKSALNLLEEFLEGLYSKGTRGIVIPRLELGRDPIRKTEYFANEQGVIFSSESLERKVGSSF